jgi:hypothetical protein
MVGRASLCIPSGNRNYYHTKSSFASLNKKLQLTLITPQNPVPHDAIARRIGAAV